MTLDDLAEVAAVSTETAAKAVDAFIEADMLHRSDDSVLSVVNWASRQFESDNRASSSGVPPSKGGSSDNGTTTEPPSPEDRGQRTEENPSVDPLAGFDDFWAQYPSRDGKKLEKGKAQQAWKRMSKAKRDQAMTGVKHYADSGQRAKDAFRWLRDECWVDWQTPATPEQAKGDEPVRGFR